MFTVLETEVVRILRATLSLQLVPEDHILTGPVDAPTASERPRVVFSATAFQVEPGEASIPRGVKAPVEETFAGNGSSTFVLSRRPLEPLRAVEVLQRVGGEGRTLLRERDDYSADYVNAQLRLRRIPEGDIRVSYFALRPLAVLTALRLRIDCRLDVWGNADADDALDAVTTAAVGALTASAATIDGLLTQAQDIVDSGLPAPGAHQVFFVFEALRVLGGRQPEATRWEIDCIVDATMVQVPKEGAEGLMRHVAVATSFDNRLIEQVRSGPIPILHMPVTIINGVGPATADTLAALGIVTVDQLALATHTGQDQIDSVIAKARSVGDRSREVVGALVRAAPRIPDPAVFLDQRLADVDTAVLTSVDVPAETATVIVTALAELVELTTAPDLTLADLFGT